MTFSQLPDGAVLITAWDLFLPALEQDSPRSPNVHVTEIVSTGGQLVLVRRGTDTLYRSRPLIVAGTARDSVTAAPVVGATVRLLGVAEERVTDTQGRCRWDAVLPGDYLLRMRTPSLDSIRAESQFSVAVIADDQLDLHVKVPTATQLARGFCGELLEGGARVASEQLPPN